MTAFAKRIIVGERLIIQRLRLVGRQRLELLFGLRTERSFQPHAMIQSRFCFRIALAATLATPAAFTQREPATSEPAPNLHSETPCLQPAPLFRAEDYEGPFNKIV